MTRVTLTDEQVAELLGLLKGSDTAELKLTVPDDEIQSSARALGLDVLEAQIRQVVFFDTPDLALNRSGLIVRARRMQGGEADTVVKLRPVVPDQLAPKLRKLKSFGVEVDAMPGGFVCSASLKGETSAKAVLQVMRGKRDINKLFSDEQRDFFKAHAPAGVKLNDLTVLGSILTLKHKDCPDSFAGQRFVAELWIYPDNRLLLELSTKCRPQEVFEAAARFKGYLTQKGIDLTGAQQTKTKTALASLCELLSA